MKTQISDLLLSKKAIGIYGPILGILLSSAYSSFQDHNETIGQNAVSQYKIEQFSPNEFNSMKSDIATIKEDIRDIKELLKSNIGLAIK